MSDAEFDSVEHADVLDRLQAAVSALAELNYPGAEYEELVDDLSASWADYKQRLITRAPERGGHA